MFVFRARSMLGILSLLIVASIAKAEDPDRSCINTGLMCIENCVGVENGNYQWCGGCQFFVQCSQGITYYQPCPSNLYWHNDVQACVSASITCTECVVDTSPNGVTESTIAMTTIIAGMCESTGLDCINDCDQTLNGVFQWCARCDYFLQCSGSTTYHQPCQPGLFYDDTVRACVYDSTTCHQSPCFEDLITSTTTKPDPCWSSPCLNDATCISGGSSGFTCSCPDRYTGNRCETYVDPCSSGPCLNGATCLSDPTSPVSCTCPDRYTGELCETYVDPCSSGPCLNGATCLSDPTSPVSCICPDRYTGELCETFISPCDSIPCMNGGTCNDISADSFSCTCTIDWTGVICESPNYNLSSACGTQLHWSGYNASNDFTRLCYFTAPLGDPVGRGTECHDTIQGLPLYNDANGLLNAGGNFGCLVSQDYPNDLPATSYLSCSNDYQQDVSLGNFNNSAILMVCLRYPYMGAPFRFRKWL